MDNDVQTIPFGYRLGVFQGKILSAALESKFETLIQQYIQPSLKGVLENKLQLALTKGGEREGPTSVTLGEIYTLFQIYMILGGLNAKPSPYENEVLAKLWFATKLSSEVRGLHWQDFKVMMRLALNQPHLSNKVSWSRFKLNKKLLRAAKHYLNRYSLAELIYAKVKYISLLRLPKYHVNQLVTYHGFNESDTENTISKFYMIRGWQNDVAPMIDSLLSTMESKERMRQIYQLYFSDYIKAWFTFLSKVELARYQDYESLVVALDSLIQNRSPMEQLSEVVQQNFDMDKALYERDVSQQTRVRIKQIKRVFSTHIGSNYKASLLRLRRFFKDWAYHSRKHQSLTLAASVLHSKEKKTTLHEIQNEMIKSLSLNSKDSFNKLFERLYLLPLKETWRLVISQSQSLIKKLWQKKIWAFYQSTIMNHKPFSQTGEELTLDEFSSFIKPERGALWQFCSRYIFPFVQMHNKSYDEKKWLGLGFSFNPMFLQNISYLTSLSRGLFNAGKLTYYFYLYPKPTMGVRDLLLASNGETVLYQNGPQEWIPFSWPGNVLNEGAILKIILSNQIERSYEYDSSWGLIYLLRKAQWIKLSKEISTLRWQFNLSHKKHQINLKIKTNGNDALLALAYKGVPLVKQIWQ